MTAAVIAQTSNSELALVVAVMLFVVAGVIRVAHDAIDAGLVAFGFAASVLAWLVA
jgi:hypothetical protein